MKRRALIFFISALSLGCNRVEKSPAEYGPEVSKAEIHRALAAAMDGVGTRGARVGQSLAYVTTRRVGAEGVETTLSAATMAVVEDPGSPHRPKLLVDTTAKSEDGQMKTSRNEHFVALDTVVAKAAEATEPSGAAAAPVVTYHRLRTGHEKLPAPAPLNARPDCGGLPDCAFDVATVIFDVVSRAPGAEPTKVTVTLNFSPRPPYLPFGEGWDRFNGALVMDCRASTVKVDGRGVDVKECRRLVDFKHEP